MRKIVVLRPGALGDAVVALPVLEALAAAHPRARRVVVGSRAFRLAVACGLAHSWVGFDDVRLASLTNPPLTTVAQPKYEMGTVVTRLLVERMHDLDMPARRRVLDVSILVRKSTARRNAVVGIDRASGGAPHT